MNVTALVLVVALATAAAPPELPRHASSTAQQAAPGVDALHRPFDEILDLYVRDGLVYYYALHQERTKFDRYVAALGDVGADTLKSWSRERQLAYWINAYNAFVLRTVIDSYPIRGRAAEYPTASIRQISGAFDRRTFRAGGRMLTLDQIERDVIGEFNDARALLALSRGAIGGPRLKSEAFTADRLEAQLSTMASELVAHRGLVFVDMANDRVSVSPLFSWREAQFSRALADRAPAIYSSRSPIERAVMALIDPLLVRTEADYVHKNTFRLVFHDFDWKLNDLTGR